MVEAFLPRLAWLSSVVSLHSADISGRSRFRLRSLSVLISSGVLATNRGPPPSPPTADEAVQRSRLCFRYGGGGGRRQRASWRAMAELSVVTSGRS